jgi:sugar phosphate isomerase/epimerase
MMVDQTGIQPIPPQPNARVGISALNGKPDLSDLSAHLDAVEALGVDTIELPTFDMDLIIGGRIYAPNLATLQAACAGRAVDWSVHGPLGINFMDQPHRLERHFEVLTAAVEIAALIGARHYVLHTGHMPVGAAAGIDIAYARQREMLHRAGDMARSHNVTLCVENLFADTQGQPHTASASRLAGEIAAIDHPHVRATVDFSHAFLECGWRGGDVVAEVTPLAALAPHLHIHDSFGRPDDIWMYAPGEKLAFGHGDLHLPVGWGALPWPAILDACTFPQDVIFNIELNPRYWHKAAETVEATRALASRARLAASK